jgi:hypothetical protein
MNPLQIDNLISSLFTDEVVPVFRGCDDESVVRRIAQALRQENVTVRRLQLHAQGNICLSEELRDALKANTSIRVLSLLGVPKECLSVILDGVSDNTEEVWLNECSVDSRRLVAALARKRSLDLTDCNVDDLSVLMTAVEEGRLQLERLTLSGCGICAENVSSIARLLDSNSTKTKLIWLNLYGNKNIGDEGAKIIAEALVNNKTLRYLMLMQCGVGVPGAEALAELLRKTDTIEELNIAGLFVVPIPVQANLAIADALVSNMSLVNLVTGLPHPPNPVYGIIHESLKLNRFRKLYKEQDHETITPALWPHVFARVSDKASLLFWFLQENRQLLVEECLLP